MHHIEKYIINKKGLTYYRKHNTLGICIKYKINDIKYYLTIMNEWSFNTNFFVKRIHLNKNV